MSTTEPSTTTPASAETPSRPQRSKVERAIVWGAIGILLLVTAIEGIPHLRFKLAYSQLMSQIGQSEAGDHRVTRDVVAQIFGRDPDLSKTLKAHAGEEQYDAYYFDSPLGLKHRELWVRYGIQGPGENAQPEVIEVTPNVPEEILAQ